MKCKKNCVIPTSKGLTGQDPDEIPYLRGSAIVLFGITSGSIPEDPWDHLGISIQAEDATQIVILRIAAASKTPTRPLGACGATQSSTYVLRQLAHDVNVCTLGRCGKLNRESEVNLRYFVSVIRFEP